MRRRLNQLTLRSWQYWAAMVLVLIPAGLVMILLMPRLHLAPFVGALLGGFCIGIPFVIAITPLLRKNYRSALTEFQICTQCGRDLRNAPGRCPECGAVPGAEQSA